MVGAPTLARFQRRTTATPMPASSRAEHDSLGPLDRRERDEAAAGEHGDGGNTDAPGSNRSAKAIDRPGLKLETSRGRSRAAPYDGVIGPPR